MRSRRHVVSALLLATFCQPLLYAQEEQWLQYRHSREAQGILRDIALQSLEIAESRPQAVGLPDLQDEEPIFAKWSTPMAEAGFLWLVLDRSSPHGLPDRLYIDSDGDGALDDEKPVKAYRTDTRWSYFGPVKVLFEGEDGPISYHLNARYYGREGYQRLYVNAGGWYEGTVTVAGQQLHCILIDQNANGVFADQALSFGDADRISVGQKDNPQFRFMGQFLQMGDSLYEMEVARDGAFVVFSQAQGVEYGEVGLPAGITGFCAGGPLGQFDCDPDNGTVRLPVGQYRIEHWAMARKDDAGHNWQVKGQSFGDKGVFQVSSAAKTELQVGEPLVSRLRVDRSGEKYSFNQELRGRLGERIELLRNGTRPRAPKLQVRNKTGSYDRTFNFEYG